MKAMFLKKLQAIVTALTLLTVLGLGAGGLAGWTPGVVAPAKADEPAQPPRRADALPAGGTLRLGTDRFRFGTEIGSFSVSADGKFAAATNDMHWLGVTRVIDLTDGSVVFATGRNSGMGEAVALSPDGKTLAVKDHGVILRDATNGQEIRRIVPPEALNGGTITNWVVFTPDGKSIAVTTTGKVIHLMDVASGQLIRSFKHARPVYACAFSPDGHLMAAGGYDSDDKSGYFVRLWEVATGKELRQFVGSQGGNRSVAFSADGQLLAAGGDDAKLRLWDVGTGDLKQTFPKIGYRIRSVAFAPDGKTVAAAGDAVHLYDVASAKERLVLDRKARGLHFSPDGKILTGAVGGAVYRWDRRKRPRPDAGVGPRQFHRRNHADAGRPEDHHE